MGRLKPDNVSIWQLPQPCMVAKGPITPLDMEVSLIDVGPVLFIA
jgi:hypothetical protein